MDLNSQNSGLLRKIESLQNFKQGNSYFNFIKNNEIEIFAEFSFYSDFFFCKNSYGLDAKSILLSDSTKAFWDGLTPVLGRIYNFSKEDASLTQLLQFFSFNIKDKINHVSICRLTEDSLIFICNKSLTSSLLQEYKSISVIQNYSKLIPENKNYMLSVDFSESIEDFCAKNIKDDSDVRDIFENALTQEVLNRMNFYFSSPSAVSKSSKTAVNVIFSTKSVFVPELLHSHLVNLLKDVFYDSAELIGLNFLGQAQSDIAAREFLKVI